MALNRIQSSITVGWSLLLALAVYVHILLGVPATLSEVAGLIILGSAAVTIGMTLRRVPPATKMPVPGAAVPGDS